MSRGRRLARVASWGVADQVLSSLVNFGLGVAVARVGTPAEFGLYGLVFSAYLIAINITRPLAVEPLIIRFADKPADEWRVALGAAAGVVVSVGLALGAGVIGVGIALHVLIGMSFGPSFVVLGLGLMGLVLQDTWRSVFFTEHRGREAFFNDLVWGATTLAVGAGLLLAGQATVVTMIAAWVIGANVAALAGLIRTARPPDLAAVKPWWREQRDLATPLVGEHLIANVVAETIPYLISAIAGLTSVAALRAAQLLLGPFNVVFQALGLVALPEAVRIGERSAGRLLPLAAAFSLGLASAVLVVGIGILSLPNEVGTVILGATWDVGRGVILPYTLVVAGMMAAAGPTLALRALGEAREALVVGGTRSIMSLIGAVIGAITAGALGAALGMAAGHWIGAIGTWWRFVVLMRRHQGSDPA